MNTPIKLSNDFNSGFEITFSDRPMSYGFACGPCQHHDDEKYVVEIHSDYVVINGEKEIFFEGKAFFRYWNVDEWSDWTSAEFEE